MDDREIRAGLVEALSWVTAATETIEADVLFIENAEWLDLLSVLVNLRQIEQAVSMATDRFIEANQKLRAAEGSPSYTS